MLTKEECVVGAYVIGTWGEGAQWGGYITSVDAYRWCCEHFNRLPISPERTTDNYCPNYPIYFDSPAMGIIFSLGKPPKPPKPLKRIPSWSLTCQSH